MDVGDLDLSHGGKYAQLQQQEEKASTLNMEQKIRQHSHIHSFTPNSE